MQFDFFPSRTLTLYLAKMFAVRIFAVLVMLVLVLLMLDLLTATGKILAVPGNGQGEILTYAGLRLPQLVARFLPYSVLLATIITLVGLNQNSEVIAMKAAGLSAHQVLAPLLLTAFVVGIGSFAFNERVVTRATATLKAWDANEFKAVPKDSGVRANVYIAEGSDILSAAMVTGTGRATQLSGVTWYRRSPSGGIADQIRSPRATWTDDGWKLEEAVRFEIAGGRSSTLDETVLGKDITPEQVALGSVDPDATSFWDLRRSIDEYAEAGRRTAELESKWWHKLVSPMSSMLMPLLGAVAAFGLARSGQLFVRAVIGMALGFAYFVVDNAALAMGNFGGYPPLLAAWAPFVLFALVGETVLVRTEE
ncbi:Lipopolysaccharide export system permease protein LptG [Tsuneonella dongtanensis]|uniref:Lipopolysaccharide export system permease protein LptG n=1 Tax=Tsuneonella dongtanensis TaxID=692370 RepID=A0A1B2AC59_9SPHN|nr:LPS export ABC transporter permease LptG [Tsuneonella dongtanensis]ANY19727.1 Lipopolysaccharide export system permease protein LptG [Tsuneonella dongtanensis]